MKKIRMAALVLGGIILVVGIVTYLNFINEEEFPVVFWKGDSTKPLVFYLSGDAGFNTFSKGIGNDFQRKGYDIAALDTKKYFWTQKTPEQTSHDVENYIVQQLQNRPNQDVILVGFSFGADVTPFVYNYFTPQLKTHIQKIFIIGPSKSNDFEIHLSEYLGQEIKGSLPVIPEINKLTNVPVMVILSDFEYQHFPYQEITLSTSYKMLHLSGDHHYGGNTDLVTDTILKELPY